mmetsp:Transcript_18717/g.27733  ORF Transcript_18717/g.27733 Transcript_18717/m.27733 type:complete len:204 (+) Transcript_18717:546-1157(+)
MALSPFSSLTRSSLVKSPCPPCPLLFFPSTVEPRLSKAFFIPSATSVICDPLAVVARQNTITKRILSSTFPFEGSVARAITSLLAFRASFLYCPDASALSNSKNCGTSLAATSFMTAWRMDVCISNCFFLSKSLGRESTALAKSDAAPPSSSDGGACSSPAPAPPPPPPTVLLRIACSLTVTSCNSAPFSSMASGKGWNLCLL